MTIAGSLQSELGCLSDWQPDCTATRLAYETQDDVWQGTFAVPAGNWEYKAALNDSWDENYGANAILLGPNIQLPLPGAANVKFYYDHKSHWVTDNRTATIAVAPGSFQSELGCPADWDPTCLRSWLQDVDGDGTYSLTTASIPPGDYEAKVAIDESWDENYGQGGVPGGANVPFTVLPGTRVRFSYDAASHVLSIAIEDNTPPTVTINQAVGQPDPDSTSPIAFTAVFSEPVGDFGDLASDMTLSGTAGPLGFNAVGGPTTYTVEVTHMQGSGTVMAEINPGAVTDAAGNPNTASTSTDNTVTFIAGGPPPDTTITDNPPNPSNSSSASFSFIGTHPSVFQDFECQLDGLPISFEICASPRSHTGLSDGAHTFRVRDRDGEGNVDPTAASYTWVIDTIAPDTTISGNPSNPSGSPDATFTFTGSDGSGTGVAGFECDLDGVGFAPCVSPQSYLSLSDGSHTFQVRAVDAADNPDATPASFTWSNASTPPAPTCNGQTATIYVDAQGRIVGGPDNGKAYAGKLNGTNGTDVMVGTTGVDKMYGKMGADLFCGLEGDDLLVGNAGADTILGGNGRDRMEGKGGNDTLTGGLDADTFVGNAGRDTATDFTPSQGDTKTSVEVF